MSKKTEKEDPENNLWVKRFISMVKSLDIGMSSIKEEKPLPDIDFEAPLRCYKKPKRGGKH